MKKLPDRVLEDVLEQVTSRKFPYEFKEEKLRDWAAYNRARVKELSNVLDLIKQYVNDIEEYELPEKHNNLGKPEDISVHEKAKAVLIAEMMQADERTASDWVNILGPRVGIVHEMCSRTIGRAYYDERVQALLRLVHKKTSAAIQGKEYSFSGDSTGQKKIRKVNYERDKDDDDKKKDFNMLAVMIANNYHVCTVFLSQQGPINDVPMLPFIWKQTLAIHEDFIEEAQFDAGFLSRYNVGLVAQHATPYFFPKKNLTLKPKGVFAWTSMLWDCITNTQEWLRGYHPRSNVETYNYLLDTRFPKPLNCKYDDGQQTETAAKIIIENFAQLNVVREEEKIDLTPKYVT